MSKVYLSSKILLIKILFSLFNILSELFSHKTIIKVKLILGIILVSSKLSYNKLKAQNVTDS